MKSLGWIVGILFFSGSVSASFAQTATPTPAFPQVTCTQSSGGGFWYDYCIHKVATSTNPDVLYYLHGLNGSQYEWEDGPFYSQIYALWGNQAPTVVSITYGSIWLLAQTNGSGLSGLYDNFVNTALPGIETANSLHPRRRLLFGLSMGGFNAAELYLKNPTLFAEVALACPAITTVGPYDGSNAIDDYIHRTHASAGDVDEAIYVSESYFPTEADWLKAAPLTLVNNVNASFPPLYVSGGLQDQYGFFEGASQFVSAVNAHGGKANWNPLQGGHCTFDWQGTALFFLQ
jgi:pimeloyl-ACP methyl ester carboxylesterase